MRARDPTIFALVAPALAALAALALTGCGATAAPHPAGDPAANVRSAPAGAAAARVAPAPPPPVALALELPLVGLSNAATVSYVTHAATPTVRGSVSPAGATVYMRSPGGTRIAVNPRPDGTFAVRAPLQPGANSLQFTAARLGSPSKSADLAITWRGDAALARRRAIAADPARYLAPASAGLNRRLAPVGNLPAIPSPSRTLTVTFSLNTIKAPPPPAVGGGGRWLGGFELTEYYPALESWLSWGAPCPRPGSPDRTGSTGCTRLAGSPWRATGSVSTAASTTSTTSAPAAG